MDEVKVLMWALGIVVTLLQLVSIGFCRVVDRNFQELKRKAADTERELAAYKLHIAENYVTQNELTKAIEGLSKAIDNLSSKLDRIEDKLDSKQDKV